MRHRGNADGTEQLSNDIENAETTADPEQPSNDTVITEESASQLIAGDPYDESSWTDIDGADQEVYSRQAGREDELSYFRVKLTIEKLSLFRSATEPIAVYSSPTASS